MTFDNREGSVEGGNPEEFYLFTRGTDTWALTTSSVQVTVGGQAYTPAAIKRGALRSDDEIKGTTLEINLPRTHAFAIQMFADPDSLPVRCVLRQKHGDDSEAVIKFRGNFISFAWNAGQAQMLFSSIENEMQRELPRVSIQRQCPWMLYDSNCGVLVASHTHTALVQDIGLFNGKEVLITVDTIDGGANEAMIGPGETTFQLGVLVKGQARRWIERQAEGLLKLMTPLDGLEVGDAIQLIKGCNRLTDQCEDRFDNLENFGGFPNLPTQNPHQSLE